MVREFEEAKPPPNLALPRSIFVKNKKSRQRCPPPQGGRRRKNREVRVVEGQHQRDLVLDKYAGYEGEGHDSQRERPIQDGNSCNADQGNDTNSLG
jgi:hypothetical protein